MTARKGFADESPEALATIVKVNRESLKWIKSHWKEAIAIGAKEQGISVSQAETLARRSHSSPRPISRASKPIRSSSWNPV
mgnify:CR=1 FL=1